MGWDEVVCARVMGCRRKMWTECEGCGCGWRGEEMGSRNDDGRVGLRFDEIGMMMLTSRLQ